MGQTGAPRLRILGNLIVVVAVVTGIVRVDGCISNWEPKNVTIYNVTQDFELEFPTDDIYDYKLTVVLRWKVDNRDDTRFEGFLLDFYDTDSSNGENQKKRSAMFDFNTLFGLPPGGPDLPPGDLGELGGMTDICSSLSGQTIYGLDENNESVNCTIPCSEYMGVPCNFSSLCKFINDGYHVLPSTAREFRREVSFGREYVFKLHLYNDWDAYEALGEIKYNSPFCLEQMIEEFNFTREVAEEFCATEQNISASYVSSGPVLDVHVAETIPRLDTHTMITKIRFKAPHDIAHGMELVQILINNHEQGFVNTTILQANEVDETGYYTVPIYSLLFNKDYKIHITPKLKNVLCETNCGEEFLGKDRQFKFTVSDIDACAHGFCHANSTCADNSHDHEKAGMCSCHIGFEGDGVAAEWGGEGCYNKDYCVDNATCVDNAYCRDLEAPYVGVECECKEGYVGDGYANGSKCTSVALIVALSVGLPIAFIVVASVFIVVWRCKLNKKRTLDRALSKFIVTSNKEPHYYGPTVIANHNNQDRQLMTFFESKWEINRSDIKVEGVIGRGNFGIVYKGMLKRADGERAVAVKMTQQSPAREVKEEFLAEISLIANLGSHENVMGMVGCCTNSDQLCLVLDYMKYGDLLHFLWDAREANAHTDPIYNLTAHEMYNIGYQVACGMSYLRRMKIIHGDIAARNILVGENLKCRISDFGLANDVYRYGIIKGATERKVPYKWISPERMMMGRKPITWKSDVWSFGILLYETITLGAAPYSGVSQSELFTKLQSGYRMECPPSCSDALYDIMRSCWEWVPSRRPTFEELQKSLSNIPQPSSGHYVNLVDLVDELDRAEYSQINHERGENEFADIPTNNSQDVLDIQQITNNNMNVTTNEYAV